MIPASVLGHVPGCEGGERPLSITPLTGGLSNRAFKVSTAAGHFAVRLHASLTTAAGVDRTIELALHGAAASAGIAPAIVAADLDSRFLITEFIDGRAWSDASFSRAPDLSALASLLRRVHLIEPRAIPISDPADVLRRYADTFEETIPVERLALEPLLSHGYRALEMARSRSRPAAVIHNDLHASNLVLADSLYLLDWEYAAVSDPLIDIACILAYYPQAEPHVPLLLAESGVAELGATSADLLWLTQWHLLIDCLWHRLRRAQGVSAPGEVDREQSFLRRLRLVR